MCLLSFQYVSGQQVISCYSHLFPFFPKPSRMLGFFRFILDHVGALGALWRHLLLYTCFVLWGCSMDLVSWQGQWNCRTALPSWFLTPSSASSDFQHPWHFDARQLLKVKVRVHDKESKDLKRLYRCHGRMFVNSNEFKWFCRKVTVFFLEIQSRETKEASISQSDICSGRHILARICLKVFDLHGSRQFEYTFVEQMLWSKRDEAKLQNLPQCRDIFSPVNFF